MFFKIDIELGFFNKEDQVMDLVEGLNKKLFIKTINFHKSASKILIYSYLSVKKGGGRIRTTNPLLWKDYNKIKHNGYGSFKKASLRNAMSSVLGVFFLLLMVDFHNMGT